MKGNSNLIGCRKERNMGKLLALIILWALKSLGK